MLKIEVIVEPYDDKFCRPPLDSAEKGCRFCQPVIGDYATVTGHRCLVFNRPLDGWSRLETCKSLEDE